MQINSIIIGIGVVLAAVLLLCVGVIFRKDHTFRSQHISENERMRKDKIHCATSLDKEVRRKENRKLKVEDL
jgi:hypothetical protein